MRTHQKAGARIKQDQIRETDDVTWPSEWIIVKNAEGKGGKGEALSLTHDHQLHYNTERRVTTE